ncbi:MAG: nucleotide exchange factor GrpE [Actinomycetota bacterium]
MMSDVPRPDAPRGGDASEASEPLASERAPADGPAHEGLAPAAASERSAEDAAQEIVQELDELGEAQRERDEYLDTLRRVQADFENYRKRMLREQTALVERATEGLVEQLLPVLDALDSALASERSPAGGPAHQGWAPPAESEREEEELANVRKGLELVRAELLRVLEKSGLSRIDAEGKPFDPNEHEAVMQEDGDGEPVVSEVVRPGYRLKGRVLRPAMVKVTR